MSEQRKQLDAMAAAQAEREKALHETEEALKQAADAQRDGRGSKILGLQRSVAEDPMSIARAHSF